MHRPHTLVHEWSFSAAFDLVLHPQQNFMLAGCSARSCTAVYSRDCAARLLHSGLLNTRSAGSNVCCACTPVGTPCVSWWRALTVSGCEHAGNAAECNRPGHLPEGRARALARQHEYLLKGGRLAHCHHQRLHQRRVQLDCIRGRIWCERTLQRTQKIHLCTRRRLPKPSLVCRRSAMRERQCRMQSSVHTSCRQRLASRLPLFLACTE